MPECSETMHKHTHEQTPMLSISLAKKVDVLSVRVFVSMRACVWFVFIFVYVIVCAYMGVCARARRMRACASQNARFGHSVDA